MTIQFRRGLSTTIIATNPVLAAGEVVWETDTQRYRIGDGSTIYEDLPYTMNPVIGEAVSWVEMDNYLDGYQVRLLVRDGSGVQALDSSIAAQDDSLFFVKQDASAYRTTPSGLFLDGYAVGKKLWNARYGRDLVNLRYFPWRNHLTYFPFYSTPGDSLLVAHEHLYVKKRTFVDANINIEFHVAYPSTSQTRILECPRTMLQWRTAHSGHISNKLGLTSPLLYWKAEGFYDALGGSNGPTHGIYFLHRNPTPTATANWIFVICDDDTETVAVDTGVALDTVEHDMRIEIDADGAVRGYIDGTLVGSGNAPTSDIPVGFKFGAQRTGGGTTGGGDDYFYVEVRDIVWRVWQEI